MEKVKSTLDEYHHGIPKFEQVSKEVKETIAYSLSKRDRLLTAINGLMQPGKISEDASMKLANTISATPEDPGKAGRAVYQESASGNTHGKPAKTADKLQIGCVIRKRFVLVDELGRGGMGVVYKARDLRKVEAKDRNPYIALKVLNDDFKDNRDSFIALQREARKSQDLAHPNIVTVYDFDKDGSFCFMTMECLTGTPLSVFLRQNQFKTMPLKERWSIIKQIGQALAYAHEKNIIHSDLKPGNIFVNEDGTVKILDFGIARAVQRNDNLKAHTTVFNAELLGALTPAYASYEMFEQEPPDYRDDIYALACVAYEILSGRHPFDKLPATKAFYKSLCPAPIKAISNRQNKALQRGLAFLRKARTPTATQFLDECRLLDQRGNIGATLIIGWVGVLLMAAMMAGAYLFATKSFQPDSQQVEDNPLSTTVPQPSLSLETRAKLERILEAAEAHFVIGRLTEPFGANSMDAYRQALEVDPQNETAKNGLKNIAGLFETKARQLWVAGKKGDSIKMVAQGLVAMPAHKGLLDIQEKLEGSRRSTKLD